MSKKRTTHSDPVLRRADTITISSAPICWWTEPPIDAGDRIAVALLYKVATQKSKDIPTVPRCKLYYFTRSEIMGIADPKDLACAFSRVNVHGKVARQRDSLSQELATRLVEIAREAKTQRTYLDDEVLLGLFEDDDDHDYADHFQKESPFAWRLRMIAKLDAFLALEAHENICIQGGRY